MPQEWLLADVLTLSEYFQPAGQVGPSIKPVLSNEDQARILFAERCIQDLLIAHIRETGMPFADLLERGGTGGRSGAHESMNPIDYPGDVRNENLCVAHMLRGLGVSLQLRPTGETLFMREYELRVVQRRKLANGVFV